MSKLEWYRSGRPFGSAHIDHGLHGGRTRPLPNGLYEWSTWVGPEGTRVLHQRGEVKLESSARRAVVQKLLASDRAFPPTI